MKWLMRMVITFPVLYAMNIKWNKKSTIKPTHTIQYREIHSELCMCVCHSRKLNAKCINLKMLTVCWIPYVLCILYLVREKKTT